MPKLKYLLTPEQREAKRKSKAQERMRTMFNMLKYLSGLNNAEIASVWGCHRSTVYRKIESGTVTMLDMCLLMDYCNIEMGGFKKV